MFFITYLPRKVLYFKNKFLGSGTAFHLTSGNPAARITSNSYLESDFFPSRIPDSGLTRSRVPDPGVKKAPDPGSGTPPFSIASMLPYQFFDLCLSGSVPAGLQGGEGADPDPAGLCQLSRQVRPQGTGPKLPPPKGNYLSLFFISESRACLVVLSCL
jgi:hypothetical protein